MHLNNLTWVRPLDDFFHLFSKRPLQFFRQRRTCPEAILNFLKCIYFDISYAMFSQLLGVWHLIPNTSNKEDSTLPVVLTAICFLQSNNTHYSIYKRLILVNDSPKPMKERHGNDSSTSDNTRDLNTTRD